MEHFYKNLGENWFTYPNLYSDMVKKYNTNSHFVEVGSWKGMSATYMAVEIINSGKTIKFDCVDTWEYYDSQQDIDESKFNNLYDVFLKNIEPVKNIINPIKSLSCDASKLYKNESLDFIFIDAAHDYDNVTKDIKSWVPKLKPGGTLAGHDYNNAPGVKKAVDELIGVDNISFFDTCWIYKI